MAKKEKASAAIQLDFAFYQYLFDFLQTNRGMIRSNYRMPSKVFLDFNDPEKNPAAFLRKPQFEALEMYVFLKEYLKNPPIHRIFEDWRARQGRFAGRKDIGLSTDRATKLFETINEDTYEAAFSYMKKFARIYPNYIFALTMGIGKTILMGTCIFYEFILANKFPKDGGYCHNALVFAPDKTVLESLREITSFDYTRVVPPEYANWLSTHIQFHFLDEAGLTLNALDGSEYNVIISNTQKIILKKQHTEKTAGDKLFEVRKATIQATSVYDQISDLYEDENPESEPELLQNQRFSKLCRLPQLGIYVDEAHHSFGTQLAKDLGIQKTKTSLRTTIDELAVSLQKAGTKVVACYNYTGTPYVGNQVLPEVVYAYGLNEAIDNKYLKKVELHGYTNPKTTDFVNIVITDFWRIYGEKRFEGMLPKIAIFASTIAELETELRPAVEDVLARLGISTEKILVNVGDPKLTSNDDLREFNCLDRPESGKQFILLVNKGKEGWNCRSLFSVAMYRSPDSRVFVLQATMRCLRSIGEVQETASVYLSNENMEMLDAELQENFRMNTEQLQGAGSKHRPFNVKVIPPIETIPMKRIRRTYRLAEKTLGPGIDLELDKLDITKYQLLHTKRDGLTVSDAAKNAPVMTEDLTHLKQRRAFSALMITAEIARYLNRSCLQIEGVLRDSKQGMATVLNVVNEYNEVLYDWIIPRLFKSFYDLEPHEETEEEDIQLVKEPAAGYYTVNADPALVALVGAEHWAKYKQKSFHLDTYCFDSAPEYSAFSSIIASDKVQKVYFTGMLTHGQTDFHIHYVDPDTSTVRTYYPDFLIRCLDGSWIIVEVKGDNMIDDPVVQAKQEYAERLAAANKMTYAMIKGSEAGSAKFRLGLM